jgi:hypothetical protein
MGKAETPPRPAPVLRKEVVATDTWGEVVVCQLLASARVVLSLRSDPPEGETEQQRRRRTTQEYAVFLSELMALAILDPKTQKPIYTAEEWDMWNATNGDECLMLCNKALGMNGYRLLSGEDVPKNA